MLANYEIDKNGRLQNVTTYPLDETKPMIDVPDNLTDSIRNFVLKDGKLVYEVYETVKSAEEQILTLKRQLADTDYITAKAVDAMTSADSLTALLTALKNIRTEYADVLAQRAAWRKEINDLEGKGDEK